MSKDHAGQDVDTWSEEFRHQCLVRYIIKLRLKDREKALKFLNNWEASKKGTKLREDVMYQWRLGNRGEHMDWRTKENK